MRTFFIKTTWLFLVVSVLTWANCTRKSPALGPDGEIVVIADSLDWVYLENTAKMVFEKEIDTPQPEPVYFITHIDPEKLKQYQTWKNLVIMTSLDSMGATAKLVLSMLTEAAKHKVKTGEIYVFNKIDPWAKDQLLLVLVANDLESLKQKLEQNKDYLYRLIDEHLTKRIQREMFSQFEQIKIEKQLLEKYGWTLRVEHDFFINQERPEDNFVMLRRRYPERWLFVHWIDTDDPSFLTREWCLQKRNEIGQKFYNGDKVNEEFTRDEIVEFLGRRAIKLTGLWENYNESNWPKVAGGPFISYNFFDEATGRVYIIDLAVFVPGKAKMTFLRRLDIMAHTFKTNQEITVEQIK